MVTLMKLFSSLMALIIAFIGNVYMLGINLVKSYEFDIDTTQTSTTLHNPASNVNVWSISGNPFVNAKNNEKYDVFDFVDYVQFMQCTGGSADRDLFIDPYDKSVMDDYDFSMLIDNCRGVLNLGAKPMLKLGSVPLKYSSKGTSDNFFGTNIYPPDDYNMYYNYMKAIIEALVEEFGHEEVLSWRFGVMTEYENSDWFMAESGNPQESAIEYCKLYDYTVAALTDVLGNEVFVGAHSMTVSEGLWDEAYFIKHCAKGRNYKTGKIGTRICYLSASFYDMGPGKYSLGLTLPETIDYLRNTAEKVGLNSLIFGIDEGRILSGTESGIGSSALLSRTCGYTYQAAYDARLYKQMFENDINYFSSWSFLTGGIIEGIPTISYHVAKHASEFGGAKLVKTNLSSKGLISFGEVEAISAYNEDAESVYIMAYNFKNSLKYKTKADVRLIINIPQFDSDTVMITTSVIDDDCNFFDEWNKDRETYNIGNDCFNWSPDDPCVETTTTLFDSNARQFYFNNRYRYEECATLTPVEETCKVEGGKIELNATIEANTVIFYKITLCK
ncbi:MAG TPA: hypothetical protein VFD52_03955 [Clostridia bacterium]|nr:hypothetical protein [Clostridia bacterium]